MVIDTNILILLSKGNDNITQLLSAVDEPLIISRITYIEFLAEKHLTTAERNQAKEFLQQAFEIIDVDENIAEATVAIRLQTVLKIPDAIIAATARLLEQKLYTHDHELQRALPDLVFKQSATS